MFGCELKESDCHASVRSDEDVGGRSSRGTEENIFTSTAAEDIKHEPGDHQDVVAQIRPIMPEEKNSYRQKMEWMQQCPFCAKWVGSLVEHVKSAHKEENFRQIRTKCPVDECGKMVVDIRNHINKVHKGVKNFHCDKCSARCVSNYQLNKHIECMHSQSDRVPCDECGGKFKVSSLEQHIQRVHRGVKRAIPCPEKECGKVFGSNADLDRHVLGCHKKWKAPCPECGKKIRMDRIVNHIKVVHRGIYAFQCSVCDKGFQNQKDLKNHMIVQHQGTFLLCKATTSEGVECRKVVFSEASLMKHVEKTHLGEEEESVPCPECDTAILPCYLAHHISTAHSAMQVVHCLVEGCLAQLGGGNDLKHHLETVHSSLSLEWCEQCSRATINLTMHSKLIHEQQPSFQPLYGVCLSQACTWEGCNFMGHSSTNLTNHVYFKHMKKTSVKCKDCGKKTTNMPEHVRINHTKEKTLVCEVCRKLFCKPDGLANHMKRHAVRQKKTCLECGVEVLNMRQHVRFVHEKDLPFKCKLGCSTRFSSKNALNKHNASVHEGKRVECPKCFKMVTSLRNHTKIVHDKVRDHVCPMCQKTFQARAHLRNHVTRVHLGLKDKCPECDKWVQDLKNHRNFVHMKVANFPCDQCDRKCITSTALKLHVSSVHLGEKVECAECGEKVCKAYLNNHIRKQHQAKEKFECGECGKSYTCRTYLAKHIQRVHLELREKCNVCGLETKDLYRHSKYTDCGREGYVIRSRVREKKIKTEIATETPLGRKTRTSTRRKVFEKKVDETFEDSDSDVVIVEVFDSDVKTEEVTDMYEEQDLKEEMDDMKSDETCRSFSSSSVNSSSVADSGMFSPIPITDLKESLKEHFFVVSESGEKLEEF